jgi:saccharopine dehydrogenase (NAD+, L-lysine-forming)
LIYKGDIQIKVFLVDVGGEGEAIAMTAKRRPWLEKMVIADYSLTCSLEVQKKLGEVEKFPVEQVDAGDKHQLVELARKYKVDLLSRCQCKFYGYAFRCRIRIRL